MISIPSEEELDFITARCIDEEFELIYGCAVDRAIEDFKHIIQKYKSKITSVALSHHFDSRHRGLHAQAITDNAVNQINDIVSMHITQLRYGPTEDEALAVMHFNQNVATTALSKIHESLE